jgi:type I restriction enzyme R subunit
MRSMVKRLLKHHRYPLDEIPTATEYVIAQCEMWACNTNMGG